MCYYATTDYACGDWKWGNMKERCPRQHRMGETCGAKLVHHESVTKSDQDCKICQEIQVKQRRLRKENDNIARWHKEGDKFSASIEKAERESEALLQQIQELSSRRPSVVMRVSGPARAQGPVQPPARNAYPTSTQGYAQSDRHSDRHSAPSSSVSERHTSSSNRHENTYATMQPTNSGNRHAAPYSSSRR